MDGRTPGRRRMTANSAGFSAGSSARSGPASIFAILLGSGRTEATSTRPRTMNADAASHGSTSASASRSLPARSGLKTVGPRMAPKTAPKRTNEIPRARRLGGYMSPAAVRARSAVALAAPTNTSPTSTGTARSNAAPTAARMPPAIPRAKPVTRTGTRPKRSIARPAGSAESAPVPRTIAGPSPTRLRTPTTSTTVSVATAAESWSIAEFAARDAERRIVLRRTGGSAMEQLH